MKWVSTVGYFVEKNRHIIDGHIIDATLERANQAMIKLGNFDPLLNYKMVSLDGQGVVIGQCTGNGLIFLAAKS